MPDPAPSPTPPPLPFWQRLLAASSFGLTVCAALLLYSAWKDRDYGASVLNCVRFLAAGGCIALAVKGTQLRHRPPPPSPREPLE
jgi:hypothetical protein